MRRFLVFVLVFAYVATAARAGLAATAPTRAEADFQRFLVRYLKVVRPLMVADARAYWQACASGKQDDYDAYERLEKEFKRYHSNSADFALLKRLNDSAKVRQPLLKRQLKLIYNRYAQNQMRPELIARIVALDARIERTFNTHRGIYQGKPASDNELLDVLAKEKDSDKRREAWEAQKTAGETVAAQMLELIKLRNKAAKDMGYRNFYEMSLTLDEQDVGEVFRIFDDLAALSDAAFGKMKQEVDTRLATRWGITIDQMQPWHYQDFFFQETPDLGTVDLDAIFARHDPRKLVSGFYRGINLDPEPILARSDLYERPGKYQHAQCSDLDREGDVRVMCNLRNNTKWTQTLLHETGHGVYSFYCDRTLPFMLRDAAHTFTTEGIAQMLEGLVNNPTWLIEVAGATPAEIDKVKDQLAFNMRMGALVFCRWSQVMVHFERALYENPDRDLNKLWWDLVEKYQFIKRPPGRNKPDWASKIHLVSSPCYYHNYLLGLILASQLRHTMANLPPYHGRGVDLAFVGRPDVGAFLTAKVFYPGARYRWDEMILRATGEPLTPKYYVEDFVADRK